LLKLDNKQVVGSKKKGKLTRAQMKGRKRELMSDDEAWEMRKRDARRDRIYLWQDRVVPYEIDQKLGMNYMFCLLICQFKIKIITVTRNCSPCNRPTQWEKSPKKQSERVYF